MEKEKVIMAVLLVVLLGVVLWQVGIVPFKRYTVLSVSQVYVEPEGYEDAVTKEWKGSYWVILMTADMADEVGVYKFEKGQEDYIGDKKLQTTATVEIRIDPQQPYYVRQMEIASVTVTPYTKGTWMNKLGVGYGQTGDSVGALFSGHYEFTADSRWQKWTPFKITILKDGVEVGSTTFNTEGGSKEMRIPTDEGSVIVNNLGLISGRYGEPEFGDILWFSENWIFQADTKSRSLITYDAGQSPSYDADQWGDSWSVYGVEAYSVYWYGYGRWKSDNSPSAFDHSGIIDPTKYGGWISADDALNYKRKPVRPVIFPGDKSELPSEKRSFKSLVEFLDWKGVKRIRTDAYSKVFLRDDKKLQVNVPFDALNEGSALFTVMIPTELADTIVWHPQVANVKIVDWYIPDKIGERFTGWIKLKQESTVRSTAHVTLTFDPATAPISITPNSFDVTLDPNEEYTQPLEFLNAGTDKELDVTFTATVTNTLGSKTDSKTGTIKLLVRGEGTTILTVYTVDAKTLEPVSGVFVTVKWDTQSKGEYTSGGSVTFDMGTFTGTVTVTSAETLTYKSATDTKNLIAGANSITLKLERQGVPSPTPTWWEQYWWVIVIAVTFVIIIIILYWWWRER
jgi:hypothetical protein